MTDQNLALAEARDGDELTIASRRSDGRVTAGGHSGDVTFVDAIGDAGLNDAIDRAYRDKYRRYSATILDHITSSQARSTTILVRPA